MDEFQTGVAFIMRHGYTNYTGIFPDLTPEGERIVYRRGLEIAKSFRDGPVSVLSSPKPRAIGTSHTLCRAMGRNIGCIQIRPQLRSVDNRDREACSRIFAEVPRHDKMHSVDWVYMTDPRCNDPRIIETHEETRYRFIDELLWLQHRTLLGMYQQSAVVTHFEGMRWLVQPLVKFHKLDRRAPIPGEMAKVTFMRSSDSLWLLIIFRNHAIRAVIDANDHIIRVLK